MYWEGCTEVPREKFGGRGDEKGELGRERGKSRNIRVLFKGKLPTNVEESVYAENYEQMKLVRQVEII